jgi:diacylglycerol kinase (ATP)
LLRFGQRHYEVNIDGRLHHATSVVIANGHYYGGKFSCAPDASLADPELHVCLFLRSGRRAILGYGLSLLLGRLHRRRDIRIERGRHIHVTGGAHERVQLDGDSATCLPLTVVATGERLGFILPARGKFSSTGDGHAVDPDARCVDAVAER